MPDAQRPQRGVGLTHKIFKNTAYNIVGRFWGAVVALFLTPFIIRHIGVERFGVWAVVGVVTGYFGLLDFGVGASFVKYIAEFYTKKDYEKISQIVNTGFFVYLVFAVLSAAAVMVMIKPILGWLNIPARLHAEGSLVMLMGVILFAAANMMSPFQAIQGGLQRMDVSNNVYMVVSIINVAGVILFLENGYGLIGLMINNAIIFFICAVSNVIIAFRILPELRFRFFGFNAAMFRRLLRFGYNIQIARISGMVANQIDKLLIVLFLSIGLVTFYQLGSSIVVSAVALASILTSALTPAFSEIEAMGQRARLIEAYLRSLKCISFFVAPLFIFLALLAPQIMHIWMGHGYEKSVPVIIILSLAFLVNTIAQVSSSVCISIDKPQFMAAGSVITIVAGTVLSALFIKTMGFLGVAWGAFIAVNAGTVYFLALFHKSLNLPSGNVFKTVMPYFVSSALGVAAVLAFGVILRRYGFVVYGGRMESLLVVIVKGLVFLTAYLVSLHSLRPFNDVDASLIEEKIPLAGSFVRRVFTRA
jgi:O-antigen/teichoic acid export membrane protein